MKNEKDLLEFLLDEAGGKEKALLKFHRRQIAELASVGKTLAELFDVAEQEGWLDWLKGTKIVELANIVNPPEEAQPSRPTQPTGVKGLRGRLTPSQKVALRADIVAFLKDHAGSSAREVAEHVGMHHRKIGVHLAAIKKQGLIESQGERVAMVYALPGGFGDKVPQPAKRRK
jgi:DNA-binding transcriptional ArsR family regulator